MIYYIKEKGSRANVDPVGHGIGMVWYCFSIMCGLDYLLSTYLGRDR